MYEPEEYKMTKFRLGIACVAAIVVVAVVVVSSSNRSKSGIMPEVPVSQTSAEVRVKAVERKAEPVSEGEEAAVSGAVAIVCGADAPTRRASCASAARSRRGRSSSSAACERRVAFCEQGLMAALQTRGTDAARRGST